MKVTSLAELKPASYFLFCQRSSAIVLSLFNNAVSGNHNTSLRNVTKDKVISNLLPLEKIKPILMAVGYHRLIFCFGKNYEY